MNLALPYSAEILEALSILLSLAVIEGLLSVDNNALAFAAMARHLPEKQQQQALRWDTIGAYLFRGLCMAFAAWIIANPWLKIVGTSCHLFALPDKRTLYRNRG